MCGHGCARTEAYAFYLGGKAIAQFHWARPCCTLSVQLSPEFLHALLFKRKHVNTSYAQLQFSAYGAIYTTRNTVSLTSFQDVDLPHFSTDRATFFCSVYFFFINKKGRLTLHTLYQPICSVGKGLSKLGKSPLHTHVPHYNMSYPGIARYSNTPLHKRVVELVPDITGDAVGQDGGYHQWKHRGPCHSANDGGKYGCAGDRRGEDSEKVRYLNSAVL